MLSPVFSMHGVVIGLTCIVPENKRFYSTSLPSSSTSLTSTLYVSSRRRYFSIYLPVKGAFKNYLLEQMDKEDWLDRVCGYSDDGELDPNRSFMGALYDDIERDKNDIKPLSTKSNLNPTYNISNQVNQIVEIRNRTIDVRSGLHKKIPINKWVRLNYSEKLIPKSDTKFLSYISQGFFKPSSISFSILKYDEFRIFYFRNLLYYKLNNIVVKNNYYLYLLNTPDNLLLSICNEQVELYFSLLFKEHIYLKGYSERYKYELLSLYHTLGSRLILYYSKHMYTQYVKHFENLSITGECYTKYNIKLGDKNLDLDFFLSFTEFKNYLTYRIFDLDTEDLINYGKDMYVFTLFNIYLFKSSVKNFNKTQDSSKALINNMKPNIGNLGWHYPSRNQMNRSIVKLNLISKRCFSSLDRNSKLDLDTNIIKDSNEISKDGKLSNYQFSELVFVGIANILENNPVNNETQIKLERFIRNQFTEFIQNKKSPTVLDIDSGLINYKFSQYFFEKSSELSNLLSKRKKILNSKIFKEDIKSLGNNDLLNLISRDIFNTIKVEEYINVIAYSLLFIITHNNIFISDDDIKYGTKTNTLSISIMIGKFIFNIYINNLQKNNKSRDKIPYSKFREEILAKYLDGDRNLSLDEIYLDIGSYLIEVMKTLKMINLKVYTSDKTSISAVILDDSIKNVIGDKINRAISIPLDLPMIVKPEDYNKDNNTGGYLLNDIEYYEPLFSKKIYYGIPSEIEDNRLYYNINKMMSTPYKLNKELLDYIVNYNHIHKLLIEPDYQHELSNIDRNKYQEKEYQKFLSLKLLQEYTLKIAQTFCDVPNIYFPIRLDQRGRLYPRAVYFHCQGSELAKALLLFAQPDSIHRNDIEAIHINIFKYFFYFFFRRASSFLFFFTLDIRSTSIDGYFRYISKKLYKEAL